MFCYIIMHRSAVWRCVIIMVSQTSKKRRDVVYKRHLEVQYQGGTMRHVRNGRRLCLGYAVGLVFWDHE
jgi:hypothetical protein